MSSTDRGRKRSLEVTGGPAQAAARSMLRAMGWTTEDLQLPQAGVAASWNAVTPCNMHLDELAVAAGDELKSLRVLPLLFHTISVSDGIAMGTEGMRASLPSRDWIADSVELVVHAERMDGLLTIAGCDKTLPAMMMAMIRLDLPSVFAYGGSIKPGCFRGEDVTIQDVYEGIGAHSTGKMSLEDLTELECVALPGKGSCASMYTANTMASVAEALGLTVPGMASPAAADPAREQIVRRAAAVLVDALESDRRPSAILTKTSFENAIAVAAALGGSTNACLHLPGSCGRGGDRVRPRRHRQDLAPDAADRGDAPRRPVHDAGPPRRRRRARGDAGAPRRRAHRRRRADRHGADDRRDARRHRPLTQPADTRAAHRCRPRQADGRLRGALGQSGPGRRSDQGREPGGQPPPRAREGVRRRAGRLSRRLRRAHPPGRRGRAPLRRPEGRVRGCRR